MSRLAITSLIVGFVLAGSGCDKKSSTAPSPPPTPTPTRVIALTGNLTFGSVEIGSSKDATLTIRNTGNTTLNISGMTGPQGYSASWTSGPIVANGQQDVTVRFSPTEERSYSGTLTINGDQTSGTNTIAISGTGTPPPPPPGPRTQFGVGQWRVNTDILPGRYFSDPPQSGCYWERQRGFSGSTNDILANDFVAYNPGQYIVDILGSDVGFETDPECGTWFRDSPRRGHSTTITPGVWLVGSQLSPGTYRIDGGAGCYWERLRDFQHGINSIIDNEFKSSPASQFVTISGSDVGFNNDGDCGTWTPASNDAATPMSLTSSKSRQAIEAARDAYRLWHHR